MATAQVATVTDVATLGTILGVWAHPDDEAYTSGGLMAAATRAGQRVVCVTATRGELGTPEPEIWPPARLAEQRSVELENCLSILGVGEHHWLGYQDGNCAAINEDEATHRLSQLILAVNPDTILTFGPDGYTGHVDHMTVCNWTTRAFRATAHAQARLLYVTAEEAWMQRWTRVNNEFSVFNPGYPVLTPESDLFIQLKLPPDLLANKVSALRAQATQTAELIEVMGVGEYSNWVSRELFVDHRIWSGANELGFQTGGVR